MLAVKESLWHTVELLNEDEACQMLALAQCLRKRIAVPSTLTRLADDPTFRVPSGRRVTFRAVEPIRGRGIAASQLLAEDRR